MFFFRPQSKPLDLFCSLSDNILLFSTSNRPPTTALPLPGMAIHNAARRCSRPMRTSMLLTTTVNMLGLCCFHAVTQIFAFTHSSSPSLSLSLSLSVPIGAPLTPSHCHHCRIPSSGASALHAAAYNGQLGCVILLVESGANAFSVRAHSVSLSLSLSLSMRVYDVASKHCAHVIVP